MGNASSTLTVENCNEVDGYRVISVSEGSPAYMIGLQPFFDHLVAVNNVKLYPNTSTLHDILEANLDNTVKLLVYNSKSKAFRELVVKPSKSWGGHGLLGVSFRFGSFSEAETAVWHILSVFPGSPAAEAGFRPFSDYIIGSDELLLTETDFFDYIERNIDKTVKFYVYNCETDVCRDVYLTPRVDWYKTTPPNAINSPQMIEMAKNSILGCDIGFGYIHRVPSKPKLKVDTPNSSMASSYNIVKTPEKLVVSHPSTAAPSGQLISHPKIALDIPNTVVIENKSSNDSIETDPPANLSLTMIEPNTTTISYQSTVASNSSQHPIVTHIPNNVYQNVSRYTPAPTTSPQFNEYSNTQSKDWYVLQNPIYNQPQQPQQPQPPQQYHQPLYASINEYAESQQGYMVPGSYRNPQNPHNSQYFSPQFYQQQNYHPQSPYYHHQKPYQNVGVPTSSNAPSHSYHQYSTNSSNLPSYDAQNNTVLPNVDENSPKSTELNPS